MSEMFWIHLLSDIYRTIRINNVLNINIVAPLHSLEMIQCLVQIILIGF